LIEKEKINNFILENNFHCFHLTDIQDFDKIYNIILKQEEKSLWRKITF
jgi:hypothetical protein